ncbi:MAG: sigma-70 family RNA polymerase sigma factor [Candidatus Gastranaerophilales bacterium]
MLEENKQAFFSSKLNEYKNSTDEKKKNILYLDILAEGMEFVKSIAFSEAEKRFVPLEDLVQVGAIGLIKAIEGYDISKNTRFKTFAFHYIQGEIKHYIRDKVNLIKAPREYQELLFKVNKTIDELEKKGVKNVTSDIIASELDIDIAKIEKVFEIKQQRITLSLDDVMSYGDNDDSSLKIEAVESRDFKEIIKSHENKIMIKEAVAKLPKDLREIVDLSFYKDYPQCEIAQILDISRMQVSRKIKKALNQIYKIMKNKYNIEEIKEEGEI